MFPWCILESNTYPGTYFCIQMSVNIRICLSADKWRKKRQTKNDGKVEERQYSECCKNPVKNTLPFKWKWDKNLHNQTCTSLAPGSLSILILFHPPPPRMKGKKKFSNQIHLLQVEVAHMGPYFSRKWFPLRTCVSLSVQPLKDLVAQ